MTANWWLGDPTPSVAAGVRAQLSLDQSWPVVALLGLSIRGFWRTSSMLPRLLIAPPLLLRYIHPFRSRERPSRLPISSAEGDAEMEPIRPTW